MRKVMIIILAILSSCTLQQVKKEKLWMEDRIYSENGEEYQCKVTKITNDSVYARTEEGEVAFPLRKVRSIDIAKKREGYQWRTTKDITDPILLGSLETKLSKYSDEGYVNIYCKKKLVIEKDSSYTFSIRSIRGIASLKGRTTGTITFDYRKNEEDMEINFARTITKEGEILHLREIAIEDASIYSRIPPYENLHERKFAMREVKPGNFLDFKVTIRGKISNLSPFIMDATLGGAGPLIKGIVEVTSPRDFELNYQQWKLGKPEIRRGNREKILKWEVDSLPALQEEGNRPPLPYILPRVVVGLKDSWQNIAKNFKEHLQNKYNPGTKKPDEIYREILTSIRFVDVPSFTVSPYPKNTKEIFNNRLANSLDKASLLYTALRSSGYTVDLILARSKERGEVALEIPSLYQFDGALLKVGDVFIDPASELNPYGYVRVKYQGTKGLSIEQKALIDIPLFPPDKEKLSTKRAIKLDKNGDGNVEEKLLFSGNQVLGLRQLKYMRKEERRNILESYINRTISGAEINSYSIEHLNDNAPEIKIDLSYRVPGLGLKEGNFILFHIPGLEYSAYSVGATERKYPIFWGHLSREEKEIKIYLPNNYRVRYLPSGISCSTGSLKFESSLKKAEDKIIYRDSYIDKKQVVPVDEYSEYKKAIMTIATLPQEWIILQEVK